MILLFGANLEVEDVLREGEDEYWVYDDNPSMVDRHLDGTWADGVARVVERKARYKVVCGVTSTPEARDTALYKLYGMLDGTGNYSSPCIRAKSAHVGMEACAGHGSLILHQCYVGPYATVRAGAVMLSGSKLCHEAELGEGSIMACGAVALGHSNVAHRCLLAANSVVLPYSTIGPDVTLGVGGAAKRMMT